MKEKAMARYCYRGKINRTLDAALKRAFKKNGYEWIGSGFAVATHTRDLSFTKEKK
jgi:hypothetical protein